MDTIDTAADATALAFESAANATAIAIAASTTASEEAAAAFKGEIETKMAVAADNTEDGLLTNSVAIADVSDAVSALDIAKSAELATLSATVDKIQLNLLGTTRAFAAVTCAKLYIAKKELPSGKYFIISPLDNSINEIWCQVQVDLHLSSAKKGSVMVSLGGDGSSKAAAAATCFGPLYTGGLKWVDTDADAENTENAKQMKCGEGHVAAFPRLSCKSIKMQYPNSRNGLYWVVGLSQAFLSEPKRVLLARRYVVVLP